MLVDEPVGRKPDPAETESGFRPTGQAGLADIPISRSCTGGVAGAYPVAGLDIFCNVYTTICIY
jgi:hypothetical protein